MNFFGHATVAAWQSASPGFLLGAMLPDFCSMARVRLLDVGDPELAAGVELHHRTDAVFHCAPTFVAICREAVAELTALGVDRGSARAVAHVGTELLLDGYLLSSDAPRDAYLEALAHGRPERSGDGLRFRDPGDATRFEQVRARLEAWGLPEGYADPAFVADRVIGALRPRPRLALGPDDERRVRPWLRDARTEVLSRAPQLLSEVRAGLDRR